MDYNDSTLELVPSRVNRELYRASNAADDMYDTYSDEDDEKELLGVASTSSSARQPTTSRRNRRRQEQSAVTNVDKERRTVRITNKRVSSMRKRNYGERPNWSENSTMPFTANSLSPTYDDDPSQKLKATRDFYIKRILFADYPFKHLMIMCAISICMYTAFAVVSGLVAATGVDEINNYLYLVIGTVTNGLITLGLHFPMTVFYWMKRRQYGLTHDHLITTTFPLIVSIPMMIFGWFALGRWISSYGSCCGLSDNQPNPLDAEQYNQFIWGHGLLTVASLISIMYFPKAIVAHLYPEVDVELQDQIVHVRTIRGDEEAENANR